MAVRCGKSGQMSREESTGQDSWLTRPEMIIGIVAPVGAHLELFLASLELELKRFRYSAEGIHLSRFTDNFKLASPVPPHTADESTRIKMMMDRGDELRRQTGKPDIFALCTIAEIASRRAKPESPILETAFVLRQLKRPEEVYRLRDVYGEGFSLVGLYTPRSIRIENLRNYGHLSEEQAKELIERDEHDPQSGGQSLIETFHLADVFFDLDPRRTHHQFESALSRWLDLIFGSRIHSPTMDEFGMFQAYGASLRSAQLSRQVGAAILTKEGELLSVGTNEVPRALGGQYWPHHKNDQRDHLRGFDANDVMIRQTVREVVELLDPSSTDADEPEKEEKLTTALKRLEDSRLMNLTEFGRAVHAEMEALLAAARLGVSVRDRLLYTTTFPCHNCTKHIVDAGIPEVIFIEPYPKSLAWELHSDSVILEETSPKSVTFRPFVGVAPRRYADLFSMRTPEGRRIRRKDAEGRLIEATPELRLKMPYRSSFDRENSAAAEIAKLVQKEEG